MRRGDAGASFVLAVSLLSFGARAEVLIAGDPAKGVPTVESFGDWYVTRMGEPPAACILSQTVGQTALTASWFGNGDVGLGFAHTGLDEGEHSFGLIAAGAWPLAGLPDRMAGTVLFLAGLPSFSIAPIGDDAAIVTSHPPTGPAAIEVLDYITHGRSVVVTIDGDAYTYSTDRYAEALESFKACIGAA